MSEMVSSADNVIILIIVIFVYLIADILRNLTLLASTTQGGTQQPPRRTALYTDRLSGKLHATNGAQRLINRTWLNLVSIHQMALPVYIR